MDFEQHLAAFDEPAPYPTHRFDRLEAAVRALLAHAAGTIPSGSTPAGVSAVPEPAAAAAEPTPEPEPTLEPPPIPAPQMTQA